MLPVQTAFLNHTLNHKWVSVTKHPEFDLWILNYTAACQYDHEWNEITTICRGLILDQDGKIVARPFPKFFNLGERPETFPENLPLTSFQAFEKIDGSLGIAYRAADHQLRVATRGSFTSTQSAWATAWVNALPQNAQNVLHKLIDQNKTPLFEVVYHGIEGPVIHYGWEGLVLLAIIENETGADRLWSEVEETAHAMDCRLPSVYDFSSVADVRAQQPLLPIHVEGYVLRFANGVRVKVKGEQYQALFRAINSFSARLVLEMMRDGQADFFITLPEELRPQAEEIQADILAQLAALQQRAHELLASAPKDSRKDFALWVKAKIAPELQGVLFMLLDNKTPDWYKLVNVEKWDKP